MERRTLLEQCQIRRSKTAQAVGTADVNGTGVDMANNEGFDSVMFIVEFGTITDGTPKLKAQSSSDDGSTDTYADLAGTAVSGAITDDNKVLVLDVVKPIERYVRPVITRGGATGAVVDSVLAILYNSRSVPCTQSSDVAASKKVVSPAEGTA